MGNAKLRFAVAAALATAAATAAGTLAYGQAATVAASSDEGGGSLQEVVVTGSRLAQSPNDVSISPVTSLGELDIQKTGLVRTEDLLNNLPQVVADQSGGAALSSNGTAQGRPR